MKPFCDISASNKYKTAFSSVRTPLEPYFKKCPSCQGPDRWFRSTNAVVCDFGSGDFKLVRSTVCSGCCYTKEKVYGSFYKPDFWIRLVGQRSIKDLTDGEQDKLHEEMFEFIDGCLKQCGLGANAIYIINESESKNESENQTENQNQSENEEYYEDDDIEIIGCSGITEDDTLNQNNNQKRKFNDDVASEESIHTSNKRIRI